jgi:ELWxxDGT repeat protein
MRRILLWIAATALGCGSVMTQPDPPPGPSAAKAVLLAPSLAARGFVSVGNVTFFIGSDAAHGTELWRTDGTAAGTRLVRDIEPGPTSSDPFGLARHGDAVFFAASTTEHGNELWRSDGTEAGTTLVRDIDPGPGRRSGGDRGDSFPGEIVDAGSFVVFKACDQDHGNELWRSDGTAAGTFLVADIDPGPGPNTERRICGDNPGPRDMVVVHGIVYFFAKHPAFGTELWRSDGTAQGTWMVTEVYPGPDPPPVQRSSGIPVAELVATTDRLFFFGPGGLWTSEGTEAGTELIGPFGALLTAGTSRVFFRVFPDGLAVSDGTREGTRKVSDVNLTSDIRFEGRISETFAAGDVLFFEGLSATSGFEPWRSDATTQGTVLLGDLYPGTAGSDPTLFHAVGAQVYFMARTAESLMAQPTHGLFRVSVTGGPAVPVGATTWGGPDGLGSVGASTILVSAGGLWAVPASR